MLQHQRCLNVFLIYALVFCVGICVPSWKRRYSSYDIVGKTSRIPSNSFRLSDTSKSDLGDEIGSSSSHPATTRKETDDQHADEVSIIEGRAKFTLSTANVASMMCGSKADEIRFCGPSNHQAILRWTTEPKKILVLSKFNTDAYNAVEEALEFLSNKDLEIYVEQSLLNTLIERGKFEYFYQPVNENDGAYSSSSANTDVKSVNGSIVSDSVGGGASAHHEGQKKKIAVNIFEPSDPKHKQVDLIVGFGGDGLIMHCNTLFNGETAPPIMCFDFGSLGFLAPFDFSSFEQEIESALKGPLLITLRMRLLCSIWRIGKRAVSHVVLNEAVIDRGPSPFLSMIEMECDNQHFTTVQGDGIIISTPTGSTAYSLAAGGSMVHPSVPAILVTPICAHTLSFRPLLLPDSSVITCSIPEDSRGNGWVSFDGKFREELFKGDKLEVKMSLYPLITVNKRRNSGDWFDALRSGFLFNERPRQKPL